IRESVTGGVPRRAAQLLTQISEQLLRFRGGNGKVLLLRHRQRESPVSAAPKCRLMSSWPVAEAAGAGLHREQQVDSTIYGLRDFRIALGELGHRRTKIAHRKPGEKARRGLLHAAVGIVEQLAQRFSNLRDPGVRHLHVY